MKSISKGCGLSARRKTLHNSKKILTPFKSLSGLLIVPLLLFSACNEKTKGQDAAVLEKNKSSIAQDSTNKPKVNIKVNKHYDDKGNVIGFDSTYTSFYSNIEGDTARMDSLMNSFDRYFNRDHFSMFNHEFNSLFFNDSLRYPDFFHDDFFMKRYELNDPYFRDMMNRMDSIKNHFYRERGNAEKDKNTKDL